MLALGTVTGDSVAPGSAVICGRVLIVNAHDPRHKFVVTTAGRPVRRFACPSHKPGQARALLIGVGQLGVW